MIHAFRHRLIYDTQMDYELCRGYLELKVNQYKDRRVKIEGPGKANKRAEGWNRKTMDLKVQKEKFKIPTMHHKINMYLK